MIYRLVYINSCVRQVCSSISTISM